MQRCLYVLGPLMAEVDIVNRQAVDARKRRRCKYALLTPSGLAARAMYALTKLHRRVRKQAWTQPIRASNMGAS